MPRRIAVQRAGGYTAASAVRLTPELNLPCSTPCRCQQVGSGSLSFVHRKQTLFSTSRDELAQR
eukprot:1168549-Alexandrium_andersonii.AAC.1